MNHKIERLRFRFADWIAGFDTRLVEFLLGCLALALGFIAGATHPDGTPVAPNLTAALQWFSREPVFWGSALKLVGVFVFVALMLGTRRVDDTRPRAWAMFAAMGLFTAIAVSACNHVAGGRVLALFYGSLAFTASFSMLVLMVESMIQRATAELPKNTSIVESLTGGGFVACNPKTGF